MPDTNDTDAILAKVRSGELSAGDAAALIANLHAASYKAMQDAQTAQAPQPESPAPQAASQPGMSQPPVQPAPVAAAAPCYQPQVPAMPTYAAPTPDTVAEKAQETVPQRPQAPTVQHPAPYDPPAYVPAASASEPHPVYDQPSPAVNPYRQPAPDTTATLPAQDATASQPEPETAYHQASPLPYNPPQETDKYIPVNEMESSSFFTDSEPTEEQEPKKKREKPAKPSKPSRAERKAEKKKAKEEAKAAKAQKKAAGRRGATSPNAPSLTGMEKIAVKVSRLQKVTAGLAVIAVLAGGVAVVSEIDANNRIAEAFSGTTEVVAATKTFHAGDEISASDLAFVSVPNSTVADGAITKKDIDDSSKTPVGRVATQYIAKGSQLTNASTAGKDNPESLAAAIGDGMEAVTIEDTRELQLKQRIVIPRVACPPNSEGKGEFTMHELLVGALRERPDRIVVGECRDDETYEMLQAMQTGHDGSLTTIHANDCAGAFTRIENMILKSQGNMTMEAIRRQIGAAIDVVVQVKRWRGGYRRIESITAVEGFSDGNVTRNELFHWEGSPENGRHVATGYQPARLKEKILDADAEYDPRWFEGGVW